MPGTSWTCSPPPSPVSPGRGTTARVDHDQAAPLAHRAEMLHRRRHGVREIAAQQHQDLAVVQVAQREGQPAVETEGPVGSCRRRGHAEPAVVVDVLGAQGESGELAELVGLLVGESPTAEDGDRIRAVFITDGADAGRDVVQRLLPGHLAEPVGVATQRHGHPVRHAQQLCARPAFLTHPAEVGREVTRLSGERVNSLAAETLGALQRAVRTVCLDHTPALPMTDRLDT